MDEYFETKKNNEKNELKTLKKFLEIKNLFMLIKMTRKKR